MTAAQIKWKLTKADSALVSTIVNRAMALAKRHKVDYEPMDCRMDITATHLNCKKLDLAGLLEFPDFDFAHDVFGIRQHINRETAQLENFFSPRCTARVKERWEKTQPGDTKE